MLLPQKLALHLLAPPLFGFIPVLHCFHPVVMVSVRMFRLVRSVIGLPLGP